MSYFATQIHCHTQNMPMPQTEKPKLSRRTKAERFIADFLEGLEGRLQTHARKKHSSNALHVASLSRDDVTHFGYWKTKTGTYAGDLVQAIKDADPEIETTVVCSMNTERSEFDLYIALKPYDKPLKMSGPGMVMIYDCTLEETNVRVTTTAICGAIEGKRIYLYQTESITKYGKNDPEPDRDIDFSWKEAPDHETLDLLHEHRLEAQTNLSISFRQECELHIPMEVVRKIRVSGQGPCQNQRNVPGKN